MEQILSFKTSIDFEAHGVTTQRNHSSNLCMFDPETMKREGPYVGTAVRKSHSNMNWYPPSRCVPNSRLTSSRKWLDPHPFHINSKMKTFSRLNNWRQDYNKWQELSTEVWQDKQCTYSFYRKENITLKKMIIIIISLWFLCWANSRKANYRDSTV